MAGERIGLGTRFMTSYFIDTNVIVYSHQPDDYRYEKAVKVIEEALSGNDAAVSVQNLAEFSRLASEKFPSTIPIALCYEIVSDFAASIKVFGYGSETVKSALKVSEAYKLHFFDSLIAATMLENGIDMIITEDEGFKKIPWLKVVNPFV